MKAHTTHPDTMGRLFTSKVIAPQEAFQSPQHQYSQAGVRIDESEREGVDNRRGEGGVFRGRRVVGGGGGGGVFISG